MKKLPLIAIHRLFSAAVILVIGGLLAFLVYLYAAFNGQLIGDVPVDLAPDLLSRLDDQKLGDALARLHARQSLPDIPADLPDPYDASRAAPPAQAPASQP